MYRRLSQKNVKASLQNESNFLAIPSSVFIYERLTMNQQMFQPKSMTITIPSSDDYNRYILFQQWCRFIVPRIHGVWCPTILLTKSLGDSYDRLHYKISFWFNHVVFIFIVHAPLHLQKTWADVLLCERLMEKKLCELYKNKEKL